MDLARRATMAALALLALLAATPALAAPRVLSAGEGPVWSVAYSPDGATLATAGADGVVRLWNAATLEHERDLAGHTALVRSVVFSADGSRLVSAGFDNTLRIWNAATGEQVEELTDTAPLFFPSFSPDGSTVVVGSSDPAGRIWDLPKAELRQTLGSYTASAWAAALSRDGALAATGSRDGAADLWDARTGRLLHKLEGHKAAVTCMAFSPDGTMLASGSGDTTVRVWSTATGELLRTVVGHSDGLAAIAFSPDGQTLATVTADGTTRLWGAETGYFLRALWGGGLSLAFSPDGATLATGGRDGKVTLLDVAHALAAREGCADLVPKMTDWGLYPRNQGGRGTCSVFATMGAFEFAVSLHTGVGTRLSAEYLNWAADQAIGNPNGDGHFFMNLMKGYEEYGACPESDMPYRGVHDPENLPSDQALADAEKVKALGLQVHWINPWSPGCHVTADQIEECRKVLAGGHPVAAGSYHSILFVGYVNDPEAPGGGAFLVRDSGGGHYTEISYEEALGRFGDVFWVE
jgi:hypothetical protein